MTYSAVIGNTYFIEVTRYQSASIYIGLYLQGLHRVTTNTCSGGTCGHNLVINGTFEDSVSNTWGYNPYYLGGSLSSGMRTSYSVSGVAAAMGISTDYTDIYAIANADSNTVLIPDNWDLGYDAYDHTFNKYDKGYYFYGDAPSNADPYVASLFGNFGLIHLNRYDRVAWQQSGIKVVPGATYNFSYWIKFASQYFTYTTGAAGINAYVNAPPPVITYLLPPVPPIGADYANTNWKQVCYSWTANDTNTVADLQIYCIGNKQPSPFDFGLDDITFYLSHYAPIVVTASNSTTICLGDSTTLNASPSAAQFVWSPATGLSATTGATVTASPSVTTTYTVKYLAMDSVACTNDSTTVTIVVSDTCCSTNAPAVANASHFSSLVLNNIPSSAYGSPVTFSGDPSSTLATSILIKGTFTVNSNCNFHNCNVSMYKYSRIIVDSLYTLTINKSRLYACDTMWQGIIVKPGGTLIIDSNSIIEDAQVGIEAKNSSTAPSYITVVNSLMNNNAISIQVDPYKNSSAFPITIRNTWFTSAPDPFSNNAYLKPPYGPGDLPNDAIQLDTVTGTTFGKEAITIGDHGSAAYQNYFSNLIYGIVSYSSNFAVFNNKFDTLEGHTLSGPTNPIGVAVYASATTYDTTNVNTYYTAIIGSSGSNYANTFLNTCMGVYAKNYVHLQVDSNYFAATSDALNTHSARPYGDHAVYFKTEGHDSIWFALGHNTIKNYNTGIHVLGILPFETESYYSLLNGYTGPYENSFINNNYIHINGSNTLASAIQLENTYGVDRGTFIYIQENKVDSAQYCVYLNEINNTTIGGGGGPVSVNDNPELFVLPSASSNNTNKAGIYMTNCNDQTVLVNYNTIHADGTYIGTAAAADSDVVGINTFMSIPIVCGNSMYNLGQDMKFIGDCSLTTMRNNSFNTAYDGLVLDMNGIIYTQGLSGYPAGDSWAAAGNFHNSQTATYSSTADNSPLYLLTGTLPTSNYTNDVPPLVFSYNATTPVNALNSTTGTTFSCFEYDSVSPSPLHKAVRQSSVDTASIVKYMRLTVHDSIPLTGLLSETQFMMKQRVYERLKAEPIFQSKDTALQNFYNRNQNTSIGKIYSMEEAVKNGDKNGLTAFVSSFVPNTTIEQNYLSLATVYLSTYFSKIDTLTPNQLATLQSIANQCPLIGGRAVFEARAALNGYLNTSILYGDSACYGSAGQNHRSESNQSPANRTASVYPNPASTLLNVQVKLQLNEVANICLYNNLGEMVMCQVLKASLTTLPINNLASGIYYYRITDMNGALIKADKVMVVR